MLFLHWPEDGSISLNTGIGPVGTLFRENTSVQLNFQWSDGGLLLLQQKHFDKILQTQITYYFQ